MAKNPDFFEDKKSEYTNPDRLGASYKNNITQLKNGILTLKEINPKNPDQLRLSHACDDIGDGTSDILTNFSDLPRYFAFISDYVGCIYSITPTK